MKREDKNEKGNSFDVGLNFWMCVAMLVIERVKLFFQWLMPEDSQRIFLERMQINEEFKDLEYFFIYVQKKEVLTKSALI